MVRAIQPECSVLKGGAAPEPDAATMQVLVLAAEATGRMIIAESRCGGAPPGEIVSNAANFGYHLSSLLAGHPEVQRVLVLVQEDLGIAPDHLREWARNGWVGY